VEGGVMADFNIIKPKEIEENVFKLIGSDWMLVSAGSLDSFNTMTASWGGMGILWHMNVCFMFIRPQRYTYEFIEGSEIFTLSFFTDEYRDVLKLCGSTSGRNVDKVAETEITPVQGDNGGIYFNESKLVLECKKIYYQDIEPDNFIEMEIEDIYPEKDYHRVYVGEILACYRAE